MGTAWSLKSKQVSGFSETFQDTPQLHSEGISAILLLDLRDMQLYIPWIWDLDEIYNAF